MNTKKVVLIGLVVPLLLTSTVFFIDQLNPRVYAYAVVPMDESIATIAKIISSPKLNEIWHKYEGTKNVVGNCNMGDKFYKLDHKVEGYPFGGYGVLSIGSSKKQEAELGLKNYIECIKIVAESSLTKYDLYLIRYYNNNAKKSDYLDTLKNFKNAEYWFESLKNIALIDKKIEFIKSDLHIHYYVNKKEFNGYFLIYIISLCFYLFLFVVIKLYSNAKYK